MEQLALAYTNDGDVIMTQSSGPWFGGLVKGKTRTDHMSEQKAYLLTQNQ